MSFMQPEVYETDYYAVEADCGSTWIVPADVCSADTWGDLADYVEAMIDEPDEPAVLSHGWIYRMSAEGYMDCTDWSAADTELEALEEFLSMEGSQEETIDAWEVGIQERIHAIKGLSRFECIETTSDFRVLDRYTGQEACMGDGVDQDYGSEDNPLTVGMEGFREAWERDLNDSPDTLEAYFRDQYERENE
jgi:hypothetical protein